MTTTIQPLTYGNTDLAHLNKWVDEIESQFPRRFGLDNWEQYIDSVVANNRATVITNEIESGQFKRAWIEHPCKALGDPVYGHLTSWVYGSDNELYPGDSYDDLIEMSYEARLVQIFEHLNPSLGGLWELFRNHTVSFYGVNDPDTIMPEVAHEFATHILMWSYVQDVPLLPQNL